MLLATAAKAFGPLPKSILMGWNCSGVPAWDVAEALKGFLMEWVTKTIYDRRTQCCDGIGEEGKRFELWRILYVEFHGSGDAITLASRDVFRKYPRHLKLEGLAGHLDCWRSSSTRTPPR